MKTFKLIVFFFMINVPGLFSDPLPLKKNTPAELNKRFIEAETSLKNENFNEALSIFTELLAFDPDISNLHYKVGYCYLKALKEKEKALYFLKKAAGYVTYKYKEGSLAERRAPMLTYKFLGQAYHEHSQFDLAISAYEKFKQLLVSAKIKDTDGINEINRQIEMCNTAKKLVANPVNVK